MSDEESDDNWDDDWDDPMLSVPQDVMARAVELSARAQKIAYAKREAALKAGIPDGPVPCVSCGKLIEKHEMIGFENGAVTVCEGAGYGSRFDTDLIWFVICDDCIEAKCLKFPWPLTECWEDELQKDKDADKLQSDS